MAMGGYSLVAKVNIEVERLGWFRRQREYATAKILQQNVKLQSTSSRTSFLHVDLWIERTLECAVIVLRATFV